MTEELLNILILAVILIIAVSIIGFTVSFTKERDYIKSEMKRSTSASEYRHWKRELVRLYLHSVPFIGGLLVKLVKRKHK